MSEAVVKVIISLVPFLILIGIWILFMRKLGGGQEYRQQLSAQMNAQTEVSREIAQHLERIAAALEQRKP